MSLTDAEREKLVHTLRKSYPNMSQFWLRVQFTRNGIDMNSQDLTQETHPQSQILDVVRIAERTGWIVPLLESFLEDPTQQRNTELRTLLQSVIEKIGRDPAASGQNRDSDPQTAAVPPSPAAEEPSSVEELIYTHFQPRFWDCLVAEPGRADLAERLDILDRSFTDTLHASGAAEAGLRPARLREILDEGAYPDSAAVRLTRIQGKRGLGASTVLFSLNAVLHHARLDDQARPLPLYINLRQLERARAEGRAVQLTQKVQSNLAEVWDRIPGTEAAGVVLLLEGLDTANDFVEALFRTALDLHRTSGTPISHIIASATHRGFEKLMAVMREVLPEATREEHVTFLLKDVPIIRNGVEASDFRGADIAEFMKKQLELNHVLKKEDLDPEDDDMVAHELREMIENFDLNYITMPQAELIRRYHADEHFENVESFTAFLESICRRFITPCVDGEKWTSKRFKTARRTICGYAMMDFYNEVTQKIHAFEPEESLKPAYTALVTENAITRDFLVAEHVLAVLQEQGELFQTVDGPSDTEELSRTMRETLSWPIEFDFPISVNFFMQRIAKSLSLSNREKLASTLRTAIERRDIFLESDLIRALNQIVYLFGRLPDEQLRNIDMDLLRTHAETLTRLIEEAEERNDQDMALRLKVAHRTVQVTLIFKSDRATLESYVQRLLCDAETASINRAFHLIYYGDKLPYSKHAGAPDIRYYYLDERIDGVATSYRSSLDSILSTLSADHHLMSQGRPARPDYQLRIATLCSFIRHHYGEGDGAAGLQTFGRVGDYVVRFFRKILEMDHALEDETQRLMLPLRAEVEALLRGSQRSNDGLMQAIFDLYGLKRQLRQGWVTRQLVDRGVENRAESVAEHVLFCIKLAYLLLPEKHEALEDFDRRDVMSLLLFHDTGEALVGDYIATDDAELRRFFERKELEAAAYFDSRALRPVNRVRQPVRRAIDAFQNGTGTNAMIARSIDRLENLVQLLVYRATTSLRLDDYERFRDDLLERIGEENVLQRELSGFARDLVKWAEDENVSFDPPGLYQLMDDGVGEPRPPMPQ